jgi:hypothetical protein
VELPSDIATTTPDYRHISIGGGPRQGREILDAALPTTSVIESGSTETVPRRSNKTVTVYASEPVEPEEPEMAAGPEAGLVVANAIMKGQPELVDLGRPDRHAVLPGPRARPRRPSGEHVHHPILRRSGGRGAHPSVEDSHSEKRVDALRHRYEFLIAATANPVATSS